MSIGKSLLLAVIAVPSLALASPPKDPSFYQSSPGWEVNGTVKKVKKDEITIVRQGMPDAEMDVSEAHTTVIIDGRQGKVTDLKKGTNVLASFQIDGDNLVAVRIEGSSAPGGGTGGGTSGGPGTQGGDTSGGTGTQGGGTSGGTGPQGGGPSGGGTKVR